MELHKVLRSRSEHIKNRLVLFNESSSRSQTLCRLSYVYGKKGIPSAIMVSPILQFKLRVATEICGGGIPEHVKRACSEAYKRFAKASLDRVSDEESFDEPEDEDDKYGPDNCSRCGISGM